jgi:hypothetical protein
VLAAKNSLTAADAKLVEDAFEQRSVGLTEAVAEELTVAAVAATNPAAMTSAAKADVADGDQPGGIDKSVLAIAEPRRFRNKAHLRYVAQRPCLLCGRRPSDPHHLRFAQPRALGRKASDEFVVPLCRIHHRLVHRVGNEAAWWQEAGIDPLKAAGKLWKRTRLVEDRSEPKVAKEAAASDRTSEPKDV